MENVYVYSGFQLGIVYLLNAKGRPAGTDLTPYTGIEMYATKSYAPTLPAPRLVAHTGNDRLLKTQIFPGQEAAKAQLAVGAEDLDLIAMLTGKSVITRSGMPMLPHLDDLQGKEKTVGVILYQAALAKNTSAAGYHFHMVASSKMVPTLPGAGEAPIDLTFDMTLNSSTNLLWGESLAPLADPYDPLSGVPISGVFNAGIFSGFSNFAPRIASFIGDNSEDEFLFPPSMQAADVNTISVYTCQPADDSTVVVNTGDYTAALDGVTFDNPPATGEEIYVLYQKAD
jgi:hypothetical protein